MQVSSPGRGGCRRSRRAAACSSSASASVRAAAARALACASGVVARRSSSAPAELVVEALVGLDHVAVERRRPGIAGPVAELDELPVLHHRDGLARELPGRHPLDRGRQARRGTGTAGRSPWPADRRRGRRSPARAGDRRSSGSAWPRRPPGGRSAIFTSTSSRRDQPARRDLGGLDLVLERHLEEVDDGEVALDLGLERGLGLEAGSTAWFCASRSRDELVRRHAASPSVRMRPSSRVRVSFVTTRVHRACSGWVCRASTCVVKPSTGTPGPAASRCAAERPVVPARAW